MGLGRGREGAIGRSDGQGSSCKELDRKKARDTRDEGQEEEELKEERVEGVVVVKDVMCDVKTEVVAVEVMETVAGSEIVSLLQTSGCLRSLGREFNEGMLSCRNGVLGGRQGGEFEAVTPSATNLVLFKLSTTSDDLCPRGGSLGAVSVSSITELSLVEILLEMPLLKFSLG